MSTKSEVVFKIINLGKRTFKTALGIIQPVSHVQILRVKKDATEEEVNNAKKFVDSLLVDYKRELIDGGGQVAITDKDAEIARLTAELNKYKSSSNKPGRKAKTSNTPTPAELNSGVDADILDTDEFDSKVSSTPPAGLS